MKKRELKSRIRRMLDYCESCGPKIDAADVCAILGAPWPTKTIDPHICPHCGDPMSLLARCYVCDPDDACYPPEPAATEQPAPYPWHADVLSGKVSIVGGLVKTPSGAIVTVFNHGTQSVILDNDEVMLLAELRPAPHEWVVKDWVMVVSTDATRGTCMYIPRLLDELVGVKVMVCEVGERVVALMSGSGVHYWVHVDDLLYIPPAATERTP